MKGVKDVVAHTTADGKLFLNKDSAESHAVYLAARLEKSRRALALLTEEQCRDKRLVVRLRGRAKAIAQSTINWRAGKIARAVEFINSCGETAYQENCK
jgi:hypothetical protein